MRCIIKCCTNYFVEISKIDGGIPVWALSIEGLVCCYDNFVLVFDGWLLTSRTPQVEARKKVKAVINEKNRPTGCMIPPTEQGVEHQASNMIDKLLTRRVFAGYTHGYGPNPCKAKSIMKQNLVRSY